MQTNELSAPPDTLYHYCSVETFYNILSNKSLWLSDIEKSNDFFEKQLFKNAAIENLHILQNHIDDLNINKIFDTLIDRLQAIFAPTFACCFSTEPDQLGQWRGYADNGQGIAIGFNSAQFSSNLDKNHSLMQLSLSPVRYRTKEELIEESKPIVCTYKESVESLVKHNEGVGIAVDLQDLDRQLSIYLAGQGTNGVYFQDINHISAKYKSDGFQEEHEWRIICSNSLLPAKRDQWNLKIPVSEIAFINKNSNGIELGSVEHKLVRNSIKAIRQLCFKDCYPGIINKIVLGPKCPLSVLDVVAFLALKDNDQEKSLIPIDVWLEKVQPSSISYR